MVDNKKFSIGIGRQQPDDYCIVHCQGVEEVKSGHIIAHTTKVCCVSVMECGSGLLFTFCFISGLSV